MLRSPPRLRCASASHLSPFISIEENNHSGYNLRSWPNLIPQTPAREQPHNPEWAEEIPLQRNQFRSYSAASPHLLSASPSFTLNGTEQGRSAAYVQVSDHQPQSHHQHQQHDQQHHDQQRRYFNSPMDDSHQLSAAYGMPNPRTSQPYGAFDESSIQAVCWPFFGFYFSTISHSSINIFFFSFLLLFFSISL